MNNVASIRPMQPADRQFVRSGWSSSYRGARSLPLIPMVGYAPIMHPIIDSYLDHPRVTTLVAEGQKGVLFGFISADASHYDAKLRGEIRQLEGYIYYLYVAGPFRGWKISRALLAAAGIDPARPFGYACDTHWCSILRSRIPHAEYDTYRARYLSMEDS